MYWIPIIPACVTVVNLLDPVYPGTQNNLGILKAGLLSEGFTWFMLVLNPIIWYFGYLYLE